MAALFTKKTFDFLFDLDVNNDRAWFEENRDRFEADAREPMLAFIRAVEEPLHRRVSKHLVADDRKVGGSMFRIHRDVRFSKDKSPYKTHLGAQFRHEDGKDVHAPGVYLHLEPGNCWMGVGVWRPHREALQAIRQRMVDKPGTWKAVASEDNIRGWQKSDDSLKRAPRGFDPEHELIEDLKRKSHTLSRPLSEAEVRRKDFPERFAECAGQARPFLNWLATALDVRF